MAVSDKPVRPQHQLMEQDALFQILLPPEATPEHAVPQGDTKAVTAARYLYRRNLTDALHLGEFLYTHKALVKMALWSAICY